MEQGGKGLRVIQQTWKVNNEGVDAGLNKKMEAARPAILLRGWSRGGKQARYQLSHPSPSKILVFVQWWRWALRRSGPAGCWARRRRYSGPGRGRGRSWRPWGTPPSPSSRRRPAAPTRPSRTSKQTVWGVLWFGLVRFGYGSVSFQMIGFTADFLVLFSPLFLSCCTWTAFFRACNLCYIIWI